MRFNLVGHNLTRFKIFHKFLGGQSVIFYNLTLSELVRRDGCKIGPIRILAAFITLAL